MNCPFCQASDTKVLDSRLNKESNSTRRRRKCEACEKRFTTFESIHLDMPEVVKNDGRREVYSPQKILSGIKKACQKRPIANSQVDEVVKLIEKQILDLNRKEVTSKTIGQLVMVSLKELDPVAYVRFASVYRTFQDIEEFVSDLQEDTLAESTRPLS